MYHVTMDLKHDTKKNDITSPLEHLFALNLAKSSLIDSLSHDEKTDSDNSSPVKHTKKVRFADDITVHDKDSTGHIRNEGKEVETKDKKGILKNKSFVELCESSPEDHSDQFVDELLFGEGESNTVVSEKQIYYSQDDDVLLGEILMNQNVEENCVLAELVELEDNKSEKNVTFEDINILNLVHEEKTENLMNSKNLVCTTVQNSDYPCFSDINLETSVISDLKDESEMDLSKLAKKEISVKVVSDIFQKKTERHLRTCIGVSSNLNSSASENKDFTAESNFEESNEALTSEHRFSKSKQTTKLNSILLKDPVTGTSAAKLKSVVFRAWHQTKNVKTLHNNKKMLHAEQIARKAVGTSEKKSDAYQIWKQSKESYLKQKKENDALCLLNEQSKLNQSKKSEKEESEMAFKSWKKQKDMLLKKRISASEKKEKEHNSMIEKEMKRKDAEMAFLAWKAKKAEALQLKKQQDCKTLVEKKEKSEKKAERDKEAQEIYNLWLESKLSSRSFPSWYAMNDRPPWTPPGKSI